MARRSVTRMTRFLDQQPAYTQDRQSKAGGDHMAAIEIDLNNAPSTVTVDFEAHSASVAEGRSEAVFDVTRAADEIVVAYSDALGELAER
jgi:hypothetical protein